MDKTQDAELTLEAMRLLRDFMKSDDNTEGPTLRPDGTNYREM